MRDYSHIISKITSTPWMIEESSLRMILEILDAHLKGTISQEEIRIRLAESDRKESRHSRIHRNVGVLSLSGPIFPKANLMTELSGATSIEQFRSEFRAMLNDDAVESILLDIDSPGGLSDQIPEMAQEVYEANKIKPVLAVANTMAASAAYYIGSQASRMYASPSAMVGSIGTYTVHTDYSEQDAMLGMKNTVIKAGKFKALHEEPLTQEGHAHIQGFVDSINEGFLMDVARGRNTTREDVAENYGQGGLLSLGQAQDVGMIDGVRTIDQVLEDMTAPDGGLKQWVTGVVSAANAGWVVKTVEAGKEHSEPGTGQGGEPTPREAPEKDDPAIKGGWRRDSPPIVNEPQQMGGIVVNREQLESLASRLSIEFDSETPDEELAARVNTRVEEIVVPLQGVAEQADRRKRFADEYPEEAARLARAEMRTREGEARDFAESYARFSEQPSLGFSTVVRSAVQEAHLRVADRMFTHENLKELIDVIATDKSIVQWGEEGSSREKEAPVRVRAASTPQEVRKQLHDLVKARMEEDSMEYNAALEVVAKENPELAQAYLNS